MQKNSTKRTAGLEIRQELRRARVGDIIESIDKLVMDVYNDKGNPTKLSTEKWEILGKLVESIKSNMWAAQCPLCKAHEYCAGCPVAKAAEDNECRNTPYIACRDTIRNLQWNIIDEINFLSDLK